MSCWTSGCAPASGAGGTASAAGAVIPAPLPAPLSIICVTGPLSPGLSTRIDIAVLPERSPQSHVQFQIQVDGPPEAGGGPGRSCVPAEASPQFQFQFHLQVEPGSKPEEG